MATSNEVNIMIRAKADLDAARSAISRFRSDIESHMKSAARSFDAVRTGIAPIAGLAVAGVGGLGLLGGAVAAIGFNFNNMKQQATIAFTTMLGSADRAGAFIKDLAAFAAKTPFEFPDLLTASQRLLAMGFNASRVIPTMTAIGDSVAALGGGAMEINQVVRALGQIQAKGKASAEEMLQLTEVGIPAWRFLAEAIGTSVPDAMKQVERGAISAETTIAAVTAGMNKNFGGMMGAQSHTFGGLLSTLKDTFTQLAAQVTEPFFTRATAWMQRLADATSTPEFQANVQEAAAAVDRFANAAGKALAVAEPFFMFLAKHPADVLILAGAIGTALVGAMVVYTASTVAAAVASMTLATILTGGLAIAIPLLIAAVVLLVRNWDSIWPRLQNAPMAILNWLRDNWAQALVLLFTGPLGLIIYNWENIFNAMPGPVQTAMNAVAGIVESTINGILAAFQAMVRLIGDGIDKIRVPGTRKMLDSMGLTAEVQDALKNFNAGSVDLTLPGGGRRGDGEEAMGRRALDQFGPVAAGAAAAIPPVVDLGAALGGGVGGGGGGLAGAAGGATDAVSELSPMLTEAQQGLVDLAGAYEQARLANAGLTAEQFKAQIELGGLADSYRQSGMGLAEFVNALHGFTAAMLARAAALARATGRAINTVSTGAEGYVDENGVRHTFGGNLTDEGLEKIRKKYPWIKDSDIKRTERRGYPQAPTTNYHAPVTINHYDASDRSTVMGLR